MRVSHPQGGSPVLPAEIEEYALEPKDHGITLSLRLAAPSAGAAPVEDALSNLLRMLCAPPAL